jgi:hypothetical protein
MKPEWCWWELVVLARKLCTVVLINSSQAIDTVQTGLMGADGTAAANIMVLMAVSIAAQTYAKPYVDVVTDRAELAMQFGIMLIALIGISDFSTEADPADAQLEEYRAGFGFAKSVYIFIGATVAIIACKVALRTVSALRRNFRVPRFFEGTKGLPPEMFATLVIQEAEAVDEWFHRQHSIEQAGCITKVYLPHKPRLSEQDAIIRRLIRKRGVYTVTVDADNCVVSVQHDSQCSIPQLIVVVGSIIPQTCLHETKEHAGRSWSVYNVLLTVSVVMLSIHLSLAMVCGYVRDVPLNCQDLLSTNSTVIDFPQFLPARRLHDHSGKTTKVTANECNKAVRAALEHRHSIYIRPLPEQINFAVTCAQVGERNCDDVASCRFEPFSEFTIPFGRGLLDGCNHFQSCREGNLICGLCSGFGSKFSLCSALLSVGLIFVSLARTSPYAMGHCLTSWPHILGHLSVIAAAAICTFEGDYSAAAALPILFCVSERILYSTHQRATVAIDAAIVRLVQCTPVDPAIGYQPTRRVTIEGHADVDALRKMIRLQSNGIHTGKLSGWFGRCGACWAAATTTLAGCMITFALTQADSQTMLQRAAVVLTTACPRVIFASKSASFMCCVALSARRGFLSESRVQDLKSMKASLSIVEPPHFHEADFAMQLSKTHKHAVALNVGISTLGNVVTLAGLMSFSMPWTAAIFDLIAAILVSLNCTRIMETFRWVPSCSKCHRHSSRLELSAEDCCDDKYAISSTDVKSVLQCVRYLQQDLDPAGQTLADQATVFLHRSDFTKLATHRLQSTDAEFDFAPLKQQFQDIKLARATDQTSYWRRCRHLYTCRRVQVVDTREPEPETETQPETELEPSIVKKPCRRPSKLLQLVAVSVFAYCVGLLCYTLFQEAKCCPRQASFSANGNSDYIGLGQNALLDASQCSADLKSVLTPVTQSRGTARCHAICTGDTLPRLVLRRASTPKTQVRDYQCTASTGHWWNGQLAGVWSRSISSELNGSIPFSCVDPNQPIPDSGGGLLQVNQIAQTGNVHEPNVQVWYTLTVSQDMVYEIAVKIDDDRNAVKVGYISDSVLCMYEQELTGDQPAWKQQVLDLSGDKCNNNADQLGLGSRLIYGGKSQTDAVAMKKYGDQRYVAVYGRRKEITGKFDITVRTACNPPGGIPINTNQSMTIDNDGQQQLAPELGLPSGNGHYVSKDHDVGFSPCHQVFANATFDYSCTYECDPGYKRGADIKCIADTNTSVFGRLTEGSCTPTYDCTEEHNGKCDQMTTGDGWKGFDSLAECEAAEICKRKFVTCNDQPCQHGGTCTPSDGPGDRYTCQCAVDMWGNPQYFGKNCQSSEDDCHTSDGGDNPCLDINTIGYDPAKPTCVECNRTEAGCDMGYNCTACTGKYCSGYATP